MATQIFNAANARAQVNAAFLSAVRWQVTLQLEEADVTSAADTGAEDFDQDTVYKNYVKGAVGAEIELEGYWDALKSLFDSAPGPFHPGEQLENLKLFLDVSGRNGVPVDSCFYFKKALVKSFVAEAQVRGLVKYTITACNLGPFSYPVGM